jgi:tetratricopeptide (TPR) repeat protein
MLGVVTTSPAQTSPTAAPPTSTAGVATTNGPAEVAAATTNVTEAIILQQLIEKIEKLESRAAMQDPEELEKLKQRLNDAESKLYEAELKAERVRESEAASRSTLYWVILFGLLLAFASVAGLVATFIYTMRRITQLGEPIFDNLHKPHVGLPHHGHLAALPHPTHLTEAAAANAIAAVTPVAPAGETRLLNAMDRLERKIEEMERVAHHENHVHIPGPPGNGGPVEPANGQREPDRIAVLLNKGEAHVNLGQFDRALSCFDEAATLAPRDPAPLVKKGYALEKMGKLEEALQSYDQAIQLDGNYSMAYLFKGGVCNRLQKYTEAIECYDRALATKGNGPTQ